MNAIFKSSPKSFIAFSSIVSGYGGFDKNSHAFMQERLAISLGVNPSDIIRLDSPKDTKEEAVETKKILADKPFILVTSAFHMKRSALLFQKEGLNIIPSPTSHLAYEATSLSSYFEAFNIRKCEMAIHEYLGLMYSWLRNEI